MFDLVPLRGAGRVVTDRDLQAGLRGQLGQVPFPGPDPVAVGAAGIGGDQQPGRFGEPVLAQGVPPAPDRVDRELGGVDPALVVGDVIDPIGIALANSPNERSVKSCTLTRVGSPVGCHSRPPLA